MKTNLGRENSWLTHCDSNGIPKGMLISLVGKGEKWKFLDFNNQKIEIKEKIPLK
jgi:hypothetical protein